jgi:hypothetical protein
MYATSASSMLLTMTFSMLPTEKLACQEPELPLLVKDSRQMEPPAVTWPVYMTHLRQQAGLTGFVQGMCLKSIRQQPLLNRQQTPAVMGKQCFNKLL